MNKNLFASMQTQLVPSERAMASLRNGLEQPLAKKRPAPWSYGALAACAALVIALYPLCRYFLPTSGPDSAGLHSYTVVSGLSNGKAETAGDTGGSDAFPGAAGGNTEIGERDPLDSEPGGPISQEEAIGLYQTLIDHFAAQYGAGEGLLPQFPAWYGGSYLNNHRPDRVARLTLVLVSSEDSPALRQNVYDLLGSQAVDFVSGTYSLAYLTDLMDQVTAQPAVKELLVSCSVDEEANRLELELIDVTDQVLALLARLDPEDDAILVRAGRRAEAASTAAAPDKAVSHAVQPGGAPGGALADGDPAGYAPIEEPIAIEPEAPADGGTQPAHYDILTVPVDRGPAGGDTPGYDPQA